MVMEKARAGGVLGLIRGARSLRRVLRMAGEDQIVRQVQRAAGEAVEVQRVTPEAGEAPAVG